MAGFETLELAGFAVPELNPVRALTGVNLPTVRLEPRGSI